MYPPFSSVRISVFLSKDTFYNSSGLSYGTQCDLSGHEVAQRYEIWTMRELDVTQSP